MAYGIRVFNQNGVLLVDSEAVMPRLHYEFTFTASAGINTYTFSFAGLNNRPFVLAFPTSGSAHVQVYVYKATTLYDTIKLWVAAADGTSATIKVQIFRLGE